MLATPAMEVVVEVEGVEVEEEGVVVLGHKVPAAVVRIVPTRHRSAQSGDIANAPPTRFAIIASFSCLLKIHAQRFKLGLPKDERQY